MCSAVLDEGIAGVRRRGWWLAKAVSERGGHRPKKGLLRGGKNQKEEGYVPSGGKGGSWRRRRGLLEGRVAARWRARRDTRRLRGICSIVGRCVLQSNPAEIFAVCARVNGTLR